VAEEGEIEAIAVVQVKRNLTPQNNTCLLKEMFLKAEFKYGPFSPTNHKELFVGLDQIFPISYILYIIYLIYI
jgi:hypothetical protein